MKLDFQKDLLKFLFQRKDARKFINILDSDVFDGVEEYTAFGILKGFIEEYKSQPSLGNSLEYFERELRKKKEKVPQEMIDRVEYTVKKAYDELTGNADHIRAVLIEEYQFKLLKEMLVENAGKLKQKDPEIVNALFRRVSDIKKLGEQDFDEQENNRGRFLLADHRDGDYSVTEAHPCSFPSINKMTSTRGFYAPMLIVLMAGPKGFKTGFLLNMMKGYVQDGYKVYYADAENGHHRLLDRVRQAMLECSFEDLRDGRLDDILTEMVGRYSALGGDFKADFYPAHTKSIADVEEELEYLRDEFGWIPDIICYDYLDLFKPVDTKKFENRHRIQQVYFDAIRLQNKWGMFGFTLSQVNKAALAQKVFDITAFAEDFGKAANAHAAFGLNRDDVEKQAGLGRVVPVMQRDGVPMHSNKACFVEIDEATMVMKEIPYVEWKKRYDKEESNKPAPVTKKRTGRLKRKVKDD